MHKYIPGTYLFGNDVKYERNNVFDETQSDFDHDEVNNDLLKARCVFVLELIAKQTAQVHVHL
jgi:hypothetical protein